MAIQLFRLFFGLWFATVAQAVAKSNPDSFIHMSPEQIDTFLSDLVQKEPRLQERLLRVSEKFLGVPFVLSPLGEGTGHAPDPDPLIRFDAVDCTTFVEQTMALSQASNIQEAIGWLKRIRYSSDVIDYQHRNHFLESQWIPKNQEIGFIEDITEQIGGASTVWVSKRMDKKVWELRRHRDRYPQLSAEEIPQGEFRLPIIPLKQVLDFATKIPAGTIVNIVRRDFRTIPIRVSHQGFLIMKKGQRYFRHASRTPFGRVVDEPLEHFIRRNLAYTKWPVEGVNLVTTKNFSLAEKKTG